MDQNKDCLNPETTALVVIDLQNGTVNRQHAPYTSRQVIENASRLAETFTEKGAFVVLVKVSTHDGKDLLRPKIDFERPKLQLTENWDQYVPELTCCKNAYLLTKRQLGAFFGTDLDLQLRRRKIETIVLCGISTALGVDTTAREAYQHGYNQIFVEDAMTSEEKQDHEYVCKRMFPKMGRIRTTEEVVQMLN